MHSVIHPSETFISSIYHKPTLTESVTPADVTPPLIDSESNSISEESSDSQPDPEEIHCCPCCTNSYDYFFDDHKPICKSNCAKYFQHCGFHFPPSMCVAEEEEAEECCLNPTLFRPCLFVGTILSVESKEYPRDAVLSHINKLREEFFELLSSYNNDDSQSSFRRTSVILMITQSATRYQVLQHETSMIDQVIMLSKSDYDDLHLNQFNPSEFLHQILAFVRLAQMSPNSLFLPSLVQSLSTLLPPWCIVDTWVNEFPLLLTLPGITRVLPTLPASYRYYYLTHHSQRTRHRIRCVSYLRKMCLRQIRIHMLVWWRWMW